MSTTVMERSTEATLESQSHYNMAVEKINRNNFGKAMEHLIQALRIAPHNPHYLSYFGFCLAHVTGDYDRAIRHCKQAVAASPKEALFQVNLGKVYRLKGDNQSAHETLVKAWQKDQGHAATAAELTRMGVRRPPFFSFLPRSNWLNVHLGRLRAYLERRLVGRRQS